MKEQNKELPYSESRAHRPVPLVSVPTAIDELLSKRNAVEDKLTSARTTFHHFGSPYKFNSSTRAGSLQPSSAVGYIFGFKTPQLVQNSPMVNRDCF